MRVGGQGFGLSYANFTFGKSVISAASASAVDTVHITIPVTNTATRDGRTVVQLYSEAPIVYGLGHFQRTLVGFAKVFVAGGSTATATIALKVKDLGRWSPQAKAYVVGAGNYTLHTQGCAGTLWDGWLQGTDGEPFDGALHLAAGSLCVSQSTCVAQARMGAVSPRTSGVVQLRQSHCSSSSRSARVCPAQINRV